MKTKKDCYKSVNHPELFEFHDSVFELGYVDGKDIAVRVHGLNISKRTEQNPKGYDLEIKKAQILFRGIDDLSYDPGRTWRMDEHGNSVPLGPEIIFRGEEALEKLIKDLQEGVEIFSHTIIDGDHYKIDAQGNDPFFQISFKAQDFVVEWDEYRGPAWYEVMKQYKRELVLNTPNGEITTEAHFIIDYDPNELFGADETNEVDPKSISLGIKYEGKNYWGRGNDYTGMDAFAALQKQLPDSVFLKCCLSCRYGSMNPYGNACCELFCMKDMTIKEKRDLTDHVTDWSTRSRHYTDFCADWAEQRENLYIYSDYPCYLKG